jgi:hypothetical protein
MALYAHYKGDLSSGVVSACDIVILVLALSAAAILINRVPEKI